MKAAHLCRRLIEVKKLQGNQFGSLKVSSRSVSRLVNYNAKDTTNRGTTGSTTMELQSVFMPLHPMAALASNPRNPSQNLQNRSFSVTNDMTQKSFQEWNEVSSTSQVQV